jgi:transcriptional regulator with XRE-family HTH domain
MAISKHIVGLGSHLHHLESVAARFASNPTVEELASYYSEYSSLVEKLEDKEYRDAYVDAEIVNGLSYQIQAMRASSGWTQADLADRLGTKQSVISRLENPDNSSFSIKMLLSIASLFDTGLMVRFVPFSKLALETTSIGPHDLAVKSYYQDNFSITGHADALRKLALQAATTTHIWHTYVYGGETYEHDLSSDDWSVIADEPEDVASSQFFTLNKFEGKGSKTEITSKEAAGGQI